MPETKQIPAKTSVVFDGVDVTIKTEFDTQIPNMYAFISPADQEVNGVDFKLGELGIFVEDSAFPNDVDFSLNADGELIVDGNLAGDFTINGDGELIFTRNMATLNLGLVKGIFPQTTPPTRTDVNWLDTSANPPVPKIYDTVEEKWVPFLNKEMVELTGSSYTNSNFIGLSIDEIRTRFRLNIDGAELLTRQGTSVVDTNTGEIDLGFNYTGNAYLINLGGV